jgi:hypothetical protein
VRAPEAGTEAPALLCVFNMTDAALDMEIPPDLVSAPADAPGLGAAPEAGRLSLEPFGVYIGVLSSR